MPEEIEAESCSILRKNLWWLIRAEEEIDSAGGRCVSIMKTVNEAEGLAASLEGLGVRQSRRNCGMALINCGRDPKDVYIY
jgi:hypothetical protein